MSLDAYPQRCLEPESIETPVVITGAAAANPTKNFGKNVVVTWVSTGRYRFTFQDSPGVLLGPPGVSYQDATPGNLKTFSTVFGTMDATGKIIDGFVYNASGTLTDLTSTNVLRVSFLFKRSQSTL
jgi:hypothetical protein